jgi:hypothetical protein
LIKYFSKHYVSNIDKIRFRKTKSNPVKYPILLLVLFLGACTKSLHNKKEKSATTTSVEESCSFGISNFNLSKRAPGYGDNADMTAKGGPNNNTEAAPNAVILLDFNGQYVSGTNWNTNGPINAAPANLTSTEITNILNRVIADFDPFNVVVTTDETVYNACNAYKRMRVIVTESWEWYAQVGGVAFINSFTWGNNTPCFVFSSLLEYNAKKIAEACSHEVGHTLGLRHQAVYDANGVKISDYNWGQGSGEIGWAPIMGASYNQNLSIWHNGPNSLGATAMQDDVNIIAGKIGFKTDDYSNSVSGAVTISSSATGFINSTSDVDVFKIKLNQTKNVSVVPLSVGANNDGSDLDIIMKVYNNQGALVSTINDPNILNTVTTLSSGTYFISVGSIENSYTNTYGMLSRYKISVTNP